MHTKQAGTMEAGRTHMRQAGWWAAMCDRGRTHMRQE